MLALILLHFNSFHFRYVVNLDFCDLHRCMYSPASNITRFHIFFEVNLQFYQCILLFTLLWNTQRKEEEEKHTRLSTSLRMWPFNHWLTNWQTKPINVKYTGKIHFITKYWATRFWWRKNLFLIASIALAFASSFCSFDTIQVIVCVRDEFQSWFCITKAIIIIIISSLIDFCDMLCRDNNIRVRDK